jgi:hypothetical protein
VEAVSGTIELDPSFDNVFVGPSYSQKPLREILKSNLNSSEDFELRMMDI